MKVRSKFIGVINRPLLKGGLEGLAQVYSIVIESLDYFSNNLYNLLYNESL